MINERFIKNFDAKKTVIISHQFNVFRITGKNL